MPVPRLGEVRSSVAGVGGVLRGMTGPFHGDTCIQGHVTCRAPSGELTATGAAGRLVLHAQSGHGVPAVW